MQKILKDSQNQKKNLHVNTTFSRGLRLKTDSLLRIDEFLTAPAASQNSWANVVVIAEAFVAKKRARTGKLTTKVVFSIVIQDAKRETFTRIWPEFGFHLFHQNVNSNKKLV